MATISPWCSAHGATAEIQHNRDGESGAALESSEAASHFERSHSDLCAIQIKCTENIDGRML